MSRERVPSMFVAVYLFLLWGEKVLLLRRYNTGYEDGKYSAVAGHVERDERVTAALVREAAEEVGVQLREEEAHFLHVMQRKGADGRVYVDFFFMAEHWEGEIHNGEPSKCDDLRWFPLTALPENMISSVREVLTTYWLAAARFSEHGWEG